MSFEIIKKVRKITGAGISDVKKALDEAQGDEEKAIEILRKAGTKIAAKKSDRDTSEGCITVLEEGDKVGVVALKCETDFVARNEDYIQAVDDLGKKLLEVGEEEFKQWSEDKIKNDLIVKIGENLQLGDFNVIEGDIIGTYLHSNRKVASVVVLEKGSVELAKDIAMHVSAMAPKYLKPEDVPEEEIAKEKEIYTEQLKKEDKPDEVIEKILEGKINKYYTEVCLLKQVFVKDDKKNIEQLLESNGGSIKEFKYYSL